jgi:Holliday junction resolvase
MNACQKGKRGEREWRDFLRSLGLDARRGQQFSGSPDSPDVVGGWGGTHAEVKRVENLNIYDAINQAVRDAGDSTPYVAHRKNGREWLITIRATDVVRFAEKVHNGTPPQVTNS